MVARLHRWATRHANLAIPTGVGRLLALVDEAGPSRIGDLARADHCSQPTMTTQVQRCEELGLAARTTDPLDGRAVLIALTPAGRDRLRELRTARAAAVAPLVDALESADRDVLHAAVAVLSRILDERTE